MARKPAPGIQDRIQERLSDLGMSMRHASVTAGLGETYVRDVLKNPDQIPGLEAIIALADVLESPLEWMIYGEGGKEIDVDAWIKMKMLKSWEQMDYMHRSNLEVLVRGVSIMDYIFGERWTKFLADDKIWESVRNRLMEGGDPILK